MFNKVAVKAETGKVVIEAAIDTAIGLDFTPEINCLLRYHKAIARYQKKERGICPSPLSLTS